MHGAQLLPAAATTHGDLHHPVVAMATEAEEAFEEEAPVATFEDEDEVKVASAATDVVAVDRISVLRKALGMAHLLAMFGVGRTLLQLEAHGLHRRLQQHQCRLLAGPPRLLANLLLAGLLQLLASLQLAGPRLQLLLYPPSQSLMDGLRLDRHLVSRSRIPTGGRLLARM